MKAKLLTAALFSLIFISCSKDSAIVDTGTIRYTNQSLGGNQYELFLDGKSLGVLNANKYFDKTDVPAGSHIVKSVQKEGYLVFPTVNEETVNLSKGITLQFTWE